MGILHNFQILFPFHIKTARGSHVDDSVFLLRSRVGCAILFITRYLIRVEVIFMYMKLKDGKSKVLTLSYDDGVIQDKRLIEIFDRYGLKATFNINTGAYPAENWERDTSNLRMKLSEAQALYIGSGHEVAVHGLDHPFLEKLSSPQVITQVLQDRKNIESQYGTIARGMAYPFGTYNDQVIDLLERCGICYSRTIHATGRFGFPEQWLTWHPTCHHEDKRLPELTRKFVEETPRWLPDNWLFYVWGHSYEFDRGNNWQLIEEFAATAGDKEDVWYATNIEVYDYVQAYRRLQMNADETMVHNPSAVDVWVCDYENVYCVRAGETLRL